MSLTVTVVDSDVILTFLPTPAVLFFTVHAKGHAVNILSRGNKMLSRAYEIFFLCMSLRWLRSFLDSQCILLK